MINNDSSSSCYLRDNSELTHLVHRWWKSLMMEPDAARAEGVVPAPSGMKARLKRCESTDAVLLSDAFRRLWLQLPEDVTKTASFVDMERWAAIVGTLGHVKKDQQGSLAALAGKKGDGDKSIVSELRFSQLQQAKTTEDFLRRLRRILQQIKGEVSVVSLAQDIELWLLEHHKLMNQAVKNRVSIRWAMDYYQAAR